MPKAKANLYVTTFFVQMVQLHPEDNYVMVVKAEAIDLVITTTKAQARAQDSVTS
jgi:hypothetical protein